MMKVQVEQRALAEMVSWAASQTESRVSLPALSGVFLSAADGRLTARARSSTAEAEMSVTCDVEQDGEVLVPARFFGQLVSKLAKKRPVALEVDGERLNVTSGNSSLAVRLMKVEDFPTRMATPEGATEFTLPASSLTRMAQQVTPAAAQDEGRPVLTGVMLELDGGNVLGVATDSYRLVTRQFEHQDQGIGQMQTLVPATTLSGLAKSIRDLEVGDVSVSATDSFIQFSAGEFRLASSLVEGSYPNWRALMPEDDSYEAFVTMDRSAMLESLLRVATIASTAQNVPVHLTFEEGAVTLKMTSSEMGDAEDTVDVDLDGDPFFIAFNPTFLKDALESTGATKVGLAFQGTNKPGVFRPVPDNDEETPELLRVLLMPMRVDTEQQAA